MRKKLFAVIMSAMMMITFMPAMAFADNYNNQMNDPQKAVATTPGFYVSGLTTSTASYNKYTRSAVDEFVYDGQEHTVTAVPEYVNGGYREGETVYVTYGEIKSGRHEGTWEVCPHKNNKYCRKNHENDHKTVKETVGKGTVAKEKVTSYSVKYLAPETTFTMADVTATTSTTAPVVKNAGTYLITATVSGSYTTGDTTYAPYTYEMTFDLTVNRRTLKVTGIAQIVKTKDWDGEGVTLTADELTAEAFKDANGKDLWYSGLVGDDKLITGTVKTGSDAGTYYYTYEQLINPNYVPSFSNTYEPNKKVNFVIVTINKAGNSVTAPVTHRAAKAGSKFSLNAKAKHGTVKVTKVQGSKYLKVSGNKILVKANAKKGSYKIKVKVYVNADTNWKGASLTKWVYVNVK